MRNSKVVQTSGCTSYVIGMPISLRKGGTSCFTHKLFG